MTIIGYSESGFPLRMVKGKVDTVSFEILEAFARDLAGRVGLRQAFDEAHGRFVDAEEQPEEDFWLCVTALLFDWLKGDCEGGPTLPPDSDCLRN